MDRKIKYVQALTGGVNVVNLHALREDGIDLTVEEVALLGSLDMPTDTDMMLLPDGTGLELNAPALAIIEFIAGWYIAASCIRKEVGMHSLELAKNVFAKFYPAIMKRFPQILDSAPLFRR